MKIQKILTDKKAISKNMTYAIIGILVIAVFAMYSGYSWSPQGGVTGPDDTTTPTLPDGTPVTPVVPSGTIRTGSAKWSIKTATTSDAVVAGDTAYIGICEADQNGYFNPLIYSERTEVDAVPDTSGEFYSAGDELLIVVSSDQDATDCNETYARWFYIGSLDHGAAVKALPLLNPIGALTEYSMGGNFVYKVDGSKCETIGQTVDWYEGGDGSYWQFGTFKIYERLADENTIVQHISAGVVGATYNDGATFEDTDGEINANYTFTGNSQDIYLQLVGEKANGAWGIPTLAVTSAGQIKQYQGVIVFTTDAIGIDTQPIFDDGWKQMNKVGLTNDLAFYYVVNSQNEGCIPNIGSTLSLSVDITIDDSLLTASTEYEFEVWFLDWQCVEDVARGSTSAAVPTGNGLVAEVGADAVAQPLALTVSSNSAATMQLLGHFTTN